MAVFCSGHYHTLLNCAILNRCGVVFSWCIAALFTLRTVNVEDDGKMFSFVTHYFTDPFCSQPSFTISAGGVLSRRSKHPQLHNTYSYLLRYQSVCRFPLLSR